MKKRILLLIISILLISIMLLSACSKPMQDDIGAGWYYNSGNTYTEIDENPFVDVNEDNKEAYISLSVNTAAYTDIRNQILNRGQISKDAVKIEEMINYFKYDYSLPQNDKPLSFNGAIFNTPWNDESKLLTVGLRSEDIEERENQSYNIVLLVDVSGSMYGSDRLGLIIESFCLFVDEFNEQDVLSIVTYASGTNIILDGVSGSRKDEIKSKLRSLKASGATAGGDAINKAYDIAFKHKTDDNLSCIIMATDGDFNVGASSPDALKALISENSQKGINLSAIGVGYGNMRSDMLESIANAGDGRHGYISNLTDAKKFLVEEIGGIINIVARDAKAKIEFNPDKIKKYRLIGYENRQLTIDEWNDENTQAGSIGSGLQATAVFEVILNETDNNGNYATVSLKYKDAKTNQNKEDLFDFTNIHLDPANESDATVIKREDRLFIASVIEFGLILRNSSYKGSASYQNIYSRLTDLDCVRYDSYKKDFLNLIIFIL